MTPAEVTTLLRQFNEWRRGDEDIPQFDLCKVDAAIDAAVEMIGRLEAAETAWKESDKSCHDLTEKVIPNLRGCLEEAERRLDCCRSERKEAAELFLSVKTKLIAERDALQDKVGQVIKRLQLIIEEPEKTVSNGHAIREMLRQATLALKEVK